MPVHDQKNSDDYARVKRVYVNSGDDRVTEEENNTFRIKLDEEVQNVVGVELTGFSISYEASPTFIKPRNGKSGNDKIDFYITDMNPGPGFGTRSVLTIEMPKMRIYYGVSNSRGENYIENLQYRIRAALTADPYFGPLISYTDLRVYEDGLGRTLMELRVLGKLYDYGFLFKTGPNADQAPYKEMGFDKLDYNASRWLTSPYTVNLRPFRYLDIKIDEVRELGTVGRIYFDLEGDLMYVLNEHNTARTRIVSSDRLYRLRQLTIIPTLNGGMHLPQGVEIDLELTIFHLSNQGAKPDWFKERFTL